MPAHVSRGDTGLSNRKWSYGQQRQKKFKVNNAETEAQQERLQDAVSSSSSSHASCLPLQHPCFTHIDELLLLLLRHLGQAVVPPGQVILQASEGIHHHLLHLSALRPGAGWGQAQPPDTAARSHPGRQHVALIKLAGLELKGGGV